MSATYVTHVAATTTTKNNNKQQGQQQQQTKTNSSNSNNNKETIQHVACAHCALAQGNHTHHHSQVANIVHQELSVRCELSKGPPVPCYTCEQ